MKAQSLAAKHENDTGDAQEDNSGFQQLRESEGMIAVIGDLHYFFYLVAEPMHSLLVH